MRKIFLSLFLSMLAISAVGQSFGFSFDEEDEPYLSGEIAYSCQPATAWNRLLTYADMNNTDTVQAEIDNEAHVMTVVGCKDNSKMRVNPFAGAFGDYVIYTLTLTLNEGHITYLINDISLNSQAAGVAHYNRVKGLRVAIKEFKQAKTKASDTSLPRKEQNEAKSTMKDLHSSLTKAHETLMKRVEAIRIAVE